MSPAEMQAAMPGAGERAALFAPFLTAAMAEFEINTSSRQSAFLAQVAHESMSLRYMREIADGSAYEGRADLGNTQPGDGKRFPGRGPIQITGRRNYTRCGAALNMDLVEHPELLEAPMAGCRGSAWLWRDFGCNELADKDRFGTITRRINGGYTHLDERLAHWIRIRKVLGL